MRYVREFKGFAGIRIEADDIGSADDPSIIVLHDIGETRAAWEDVAVALRDAGRHAINVDLRGHGGSDWPDDGRYDLTAYVEDLRSLLGQMRTRPVVMAAGHAGWIAAMALTEDAATLAAGLVLIDLPEGDDLPPSTGRSNGKVDPRIFDSFGAAGALAAISAAAPQMGVPVFAVSRSVSPNGFLDSLADAEAVVLEDGSPDSSETLNALLIDFLERKHPRFIPEFREGSDARTFRDALGCFATGVTIITAIGPDGEPIGLTANSFTSVSLDPPLLLVCVANNAGSAPVLRQAERFAVNVLQIGQQPTSNRFAGKGEDRFANTPWEVGEFGTPVLTSSLSSFECASEAVHDGGDHFILVGRVLKAMFEPRRDPLLYFRGKYRRLHFA
jgi:flavin reductase (DIM6/NTAB) family NADH-FMN oxidoreductase RutF